MTESNNNIHSIIFSGGSNFTQTLLCTQTYIIHFIHHIGLSLILNVEQPEYLSLYGQTAGVHVSINPPDELPTPGIEGFGIRPGTETSVSLRLVRA